MVADTSDATDIHKLRVAKHTAIIVRPLAVIIQVDFGGLFVLLMMAGTKKIANNQHTVEITISCQNILP